MVQGTKSGGVHGTNSGVAMLAGVVRSRQTTGGVVHGTKNGMVLGPKSGVV